MSAFYCGFGTFDTISENDKKALQELKAKITQESPLTLNDLLLLLRHYPLPQCEEGVFTILGVEADGVTPFIEVTSPSVSDVFDALLVTESQHEGSCVHLVFQGCLPWNFIYTV